MKNKKELTKRVKDLRDQINRLIKEIKLLEKEADQPDFTDPIKAVGTLETVQTNLVSKRSVLTICQEQLKQVNNELNEIQETERIAKIAILRMDERKRLLDVIKEIDVLRNVYNQFEAIGYEITAQRGHKELIPNLKTAMSAIEAFQHNLRGFRPELFGENPRPIKKEQLIASQKANIKKLEDQIAELEKKKNHRYHPGEVIPDISWTTKINKVQDRLKAARVTLARLKGHADEFAEKEKAEVKAKLEREKTEREMVLRDTSSGGARKLRNRQQNEGKEQFI